MRSLAAVVSAPAPRRAARPPPAPRPSAAGTQGSVRSSSRRATVVSKLATQSKLQEAEARRASAKARPVKRAKQLTQDMLIREALETEETNTESLLHFLEREEERKARQRQSTKKEIQGPFVRWISVGLPQNIWAMRAHEHEARAKTEGAEPVQPQDGPAQPRPEAPGPMGPAGASLAGPKEEPALLPQEAPARAPSEVPAQQSSEIPAQGPAQRSSETSTSGPEVPGQGSSEAPGQGSSEAPGQGSSETPGQGSSETPGQGSSETPGQGSSETPVQGPSETPTRCPAEAPAQGPTETPSQEPTETPSQGSAETPEPLRASASAPASRVLVTQAEPTATDTPPSESEVLSVSAPGLADPGAGDITGRTILTLQNMEPTTTWVDEFRYLLGDHCAWDRLPIVPSRNRPFRPRQSLCVITGLPARYRDPHTGLPYATTQAYAMLRRVLDGEFLWTGSPHRATALAAGCFGSALADCGAGHVFS